MKSQIPFSREEEATRERQPLSCDTGSECGAVPAHQAAQGSAGGPAKGSSGQSSVRLAGGSGESLGGSSGESAGGPARGCTGVAAPTVSCPAEDGQRCGRKAEGYGVRKFGRCRRRAG